MSSDVSNIIDTHLVPKRTADLTSTGAAAAAQGQFQAISDAVAILADDGAHAIRVRCKPCNIFGKVDVNSPVTIKIHAGQNVTKPAVAAVGTLAHAEANTVDCVATVIPSASGEIDISFTLDAPDAKPPRVTLQHRHYAASATIEIT